MRHLLQLCLLLQSYILSGQPQLQFDHLEIPNKTIVVMIQGQQGFMWFGTNNGLLRYDGYEFKEYNTNPYDSSGYTGAAVSRLFQDHEGDLWFCGIDERGLFRFNPITEHFKHYTHDPNDSTSINTNSVTGIFQDSQNRLWVGTRRGLNLHDRRLDNFKRYNFVEDLNSNSEKFNTRAYGNSVNFLFEFQQDEFWLSAGAGPIIFNPTTGKFKEWPEQFENFPRDGYWRFHKDHKGQIWSTAPQLHKYDSVNKRFIPVQYSNTTDDIYTFGIAEDQHGQLFTKADVPRKSGIAVFDTRTHQIHRFFPNSDDPYSIKSGGLNYELLIDRSGILWVSYSPGTASGGFVSRYNPNKIISHHVDFLPVRKQTNDLTIGAIQIDHTTNVWIGTPGNGLIKYNPANKSSEQYFFNPDGVGTPQNHISAVYQDKYHNIWAGGWRSGLFKLDPSSGNWKNYREELTKNGVGWDHVGKIFEDSKGNLWLAHLGSISGIVLSKLKFDGTTGFNREFTDYQAYSYQLDNNKGISDFRVFAINEDVQGNVWIGTQKGLNRYNSEQDDFTTYLPTESVVHLFSDQQGTLWVGTETGLFKANREDLEDSIKFTRVELEHEMDLVQGEHELAGKITAILYEDERGSLWGIVDNKILRYHPPSSGGGILDDGDGVVVGQVRAASVSNGLIAVAGFNGFILFHPDSLKRNYFIPPVVITEFQIDNLPVSLADSLDGKPILSKVINHTEHITLPYGTNFGFKFAALDYANPERNHYSFGIFKYSGEEMRWPTGHQTTTRTATYNNLWEGEYIFVVRGANNSRVWNEKGTSIRITILPPMWRTWWAYSLYAIAFIGIIMGFFRFFMVRERLKGDLKLEQLELEKVKEMDSVKTQFFANVSHEFRTPLTLILGPLKQMYEGTFKGDTRSVMGVMIRNSKRLLHLINQLLDFSKLEAGEMKLVASEGDLVEFARTIFSAFESTAQSRGIRYDFQSNREDLLVYYDRDKLEKILINLLSNAFKFTEEGSISLVINDKAENSKADRGHGVAEIRVTDTGLGISAEKLPHIFDRFFQVDPSYTRVQEGTGIGLALTKELVELHHGTINVTSIAGTGTTFSIHLPLGKDHLGEEELMVRTGFYPVEDNAIESLADELSLTTNGENEDESLPLVLIVDDNADMRSYIMASIADDFRLVEAPNGIRGWESAIQKIPDLVISDVMMPLMDGHQLCERLKTDERTSHIPVVLLTARAGEKAKLEGLETGADDYLTKPFSADELNIRVKNLIDIRRKLSERFSKDISLLPKDIAVTSLDEQFLEKAMEVVETHRTNAEFRAEDFAREVGMSRSQLHRKLGALTGQTTSDFIRSYRLNYARQLIEKNFGNMTQVAYESGFSSPSYFTVCFKKQFGVSPSEFAKANSEEL